MIERFTLLESKVERLLIDVAVIKANYATREDVESVRIALHSSLSTLTKWLVGVLLIVPGVWLGLARWLN